MDPTVAPDWGCGLGVGTAAGAHRRTQKAQTSSMLIHLLRN